ncbi:MAG: CcdB family protein [Janthinobacterium lividum]
MARYDVYRANEHDLLLDLQADILDDLGTRFVVLLRPRGRVEPPIRRLNPVFAIDGIDHVMLTQLVASVPPRELGRPLATLAAEADAIRDALDFLLVGF